MNESEYTIIRKYELTQFTNLITQAFSFEEMDMELIFPLGLSGEVPGTTQKTRAKELVTACDRRDKLPELLAECKQQRPGKTWDNVVKDSESKPSPLNSFISDSSLPIGEPKDKKRSPWLALGVLIAVMFAGGVVGWLVGNGRDASISTQQDAIIYDFEQQDEVEQWVLEFAGQTTRPIRSTEMAFNGRYAIKIDTNLQAANLRDPSSGLPQLVTTVPDTQNKAIVIRVFVPQTAPSNLAVQLFLREDSSTVWGPYSRLVPGQWTTLSWLTTDMPLVEPVFNQLGIEIKMDSVKRTGDGTEYNDPVYLDMVEVLPYADRFPSVENILQPIRLYHFEDSRQVPEELQATRDYAGNLNMSELFVGVTDKAFLYGTQSLSFNAQLQPYQNETGFAGIFLDLQELTPVDAVSAYIFIPSTPETEGAVNFNAAFTAESQEIRDGNRTIRKGYYSHTIHVPVGEWVPFFWGTAYANGSCTEEDDAGNCTEEAKLLWHEWKNPALSNLTLRIWRIDESYDGPIYIDHLTLYAVAP